MSPRRRLPAVVLVRPVRMLPVRAVAAVAIFVAGLGLGAGACASDPPDPNQPPRPTGRTRADAAAPTPDAPGPFTTYPELIPGAAPTSAPPGPCALGPWAQGKDKVAPSPNPPCGLAPAQVPMFVSLGWDDNASAEGMTWAAKILKDRGMTGSFYMTSSYGSSRNTTLSWREARAQGHEIGNHTVYHLDGAMFTAAEWEKELADCTTFLTSKGFVVPPAELVGFRSPFLSYNDAMLATVQKLGFQYDCSIEEGHQGDQDGTNFFWPYTLDGRSPGHTAQVGGAGGKMEIEPHPGLWELPVYAVIVPPDEECEKYGVPRGLRAKLATIQPWFAGTAGRSGGKITGFDYNMWARKKDGGFEMSRAELAATLKYTLDLRLRGNRAPFLLGVHSAYYIDAWNSNAPGAPTAAERRQAIEEFLDYARTRPDVKVTSYKAILDWLRNPLPKDGAGGGGGDGGAGDGGAADAARPG